MCGRFGIALSIAKLEKRFNKPVEGIKTIEGKYGSLEKYIQKCYNLSPGDYVPVITSTNPSVIQFSRFGFSPDWAKTDLMQINARTEGSRNAENDVNYKGGKDIINTPMFRNAIRNSRCLVIADYFIEGTLTDKLNKPYVVYLRNKQRPFGMAGLHTMYTHKISGELIPNFAIITITANKLIEALPYNRMPVIIPRSRELQWLNANEHLASVTELLQPYPFEQMNAYRIASEIKNPKNSGLQLITPLEPPIITETEVQLNQILVQSGFGRLKFKKPDNNPEQNNFNN